MFGGGESSSGADGGGSHGCDHRGGCRGVWPAGRAGTDAPDPGRGPAGPIVHPGNTRTTDGEALEAADLWAGQPLRRADLVRAEWALGWRFAARRAWWRGDRPRVRLLADPGSRFWDVEITLPERPSPKGREP
jgi:hypothetical protein